MFKFIANIIAAQRNAKALVEAKADLAALYVKADALTALATNGALQCARYEMAQIRASADHFIRDVHVGAKAAGAAEKAAELAGDLLHSMHELERKVLVAMDDEVGHRLANIAEEVGISVDHVRTLARGLVVKGLAYFGPLFDLDDGTPKGSGYCLTPEGYALKVRAVAA